MFDSRPGPSGIKRSPSEEPESPEPKRLLTEEGIKDFLGGIWPISSQEHDYVDDGLDSDVSEDDTVVIRRSRPQMPVLDPNLTPQVPPGWPEDSLSSFMPAHFLEGGDESNFEPSTPQSTPATFFEMVLPPPLLQLIVSSTNQNAELIKVVNKKSFYYSTWKSLSEVEFKIFLGLLYHMEEIRLPRVKDYWSSSRLFSIPIFQNMMPRNRFLAIIGALSFNVVPPPDASLLRDDPLYKVRPLIDHLNNLITSLHCPGMTPFEESMRTFNDSSLFDEYSWHKRVGIYIFQMLLQISWIIYNDQCGPEKTSFRRFRVTIIDSLLPQFPSPETLDLPPGEKPHYMSYIGLNEKGKKRRKRCKYCMEIRNKRKESYFCCLGCSNQPGFCIDGCFAKFHGYV